MLGRKIHEADGLRVFVAVLEEGDEVRECLTRLAREERLDAAGLTAVGAFSSATLRFFDPERRDYEEFPVDEQVEVVTLVGDVARGEDGEPMAHLHAVLARRGGATVGGDLKAARVRPTLEVILTETPAHLRRFHDARSGLALIRP